MKTSRSYIFHHFRKNLRMTTCVIPKFGFHLGLALNKQFCVKLVTIYIYIYRYISHYRHFFHMIFVPETYCIHFKVFIPTTVIIISFLSIGSTEKIDQRLGHFQKTFKLTGNEVRNLAVKRPRLITYHMSHIQVLISL